MKDLKIIVCLLRNAQQGASVGIGKTEAEALDNATYHFAAWASMTPDLVARRIASHVIVATYFEREMDL